MTSTHKVYQSSTSCPVRSKREAVLIVGHSDGWIQVFAEKSVDVRIEMLPHSTTPEAEVLAEEYVGLSLPKRYRDVYWPSMQRAADMMRLVLPSDIARRDWELDFLKALDSAGEILRGDARQERKIWML